MFKASKRILVAALAVGAAAAPATASAQRILPDSAPSPQSLAVGASASPTNQASSSAFAWGDAGIGAAGAVALMGAGGVFLGGRRRRGHTVRAS